MRTFRHRVGYVRYNAAGAFDQQRLDKYIADIAAGNYGGFDSYPSGFSGYGSPYSPPSPNTESMRDHISFNTLTGSPTNYINFGSITRQSGLLFSWNSSDTITIKAKGVYLYSLVIEGTSSDVAGKVQRFGISQQYGWPFSYNTYHFSGVLDASGIFYIGSSLTGIVTTAPCTLKIAWSSGDHASGAITQGTFTIAKLQSI